MQLINKFKPRTEFSNNVLTLITGTTIAQAIPIAISPILTRIYTPEDFGIFALFFALTIIFGSIANGRYELAVMLPRKDEDAINIFALGMIINIIISIVLLCVVIIFQEFFIMFLKSNEIGFWLYFIPVSVFFIGFYYNLEYFNNRKKYYKDIRNTVIIKSIILAVIQLSVGFMKAGAAGLISGEVFSRIFANMKLLKNIVSDKILISKIKILKIVALSKKYKDFPKYSLPSSLADILTLQLPFLFLPKIFSLAISGYFSLAQKLIGLPGALLARSISQVYFQTISENKNKNIKNMPLLLNTIKKLFFISLPISIIIFLFAPSLFEIIFGIEWRISGEIAKYLALIFFITFIVSTVSNTLIVYKKLKRLAMWQYSYLVSSVCFFSICMFYKVNFEEFLVYFVIHEYVMYSVYFYLIVTTVKQMDNLIEG